MTVYLGTHGKVELQREFDGSALSSTIKVDDVNATAKRFSFDFEHGQLLTGDQIEITSTDDSALDFIDVSGSAYTDSSIKKFIYVDELDGIRLYDSFANAVNGGKTNATTLRAPGDDIKIKVEVKNASYRLIAQVNSFEINTERETVDTTTLSDDFRSRVNTLISGSGRISAFWDYTGDTTNELPNYLMELALRTRVGSNFKGKFYLKAANYNPSGVAAQSNDEIWYQANGIITAAAVQFAPDNTVQITADFITTGEIQIRMDLEVADTTLTEGGDTVVLDQDDTATLDIDSEED
tara:strand:- start:2319 stop:3203 length:885 start_codon:yes stop_codon:yes gene_type:complete